MHIRAFIEDDYADVTRLHNAAYGDFAKYVDELRYRDSHYPEGYRWARWTALNADERVVGFAEYHNSLGMFDPRKFAIEFTVDKQALGQGLATRLYDTVMQALEALEPVSVSTWARADMPSLVRFLARRGFAPRDGLFTSSLDLRTFDSARWLPRMTAIESRGIQLCSLADLGPEDPAVRRNLYDLWLAVRGDVPIPDGETRSEPMTFEAYWHETTAGAALLAPGYFIAIHEGQLVGLSQLWLSPLSGTLRTGLTAVRREYRRRGIALALKVRALTFAQTRGYERVVTDNAAVNDGMLAINAALGFVRNPVWTRYLREFPAGDCANG